ncbi:unnamed protein product [Auanema sp. JU1783]|nr:unnamed protein product [Auanema sp. JU1783]
MELTGFRHQVGGHFGLLQCAGHVAKPINRREMEFYELMGDNIRQFAPEYCGQVRVCATVDEDGDLHLVTDSPLLCHPEPSICRKDAMAMSFRVGKGGRVEVDLDKPSNHWAATCQSKVVQKLLEGSCSRFILLENVVASYSRPCILDLKIGTRQHGDDASESKRHRQLRKCRESTSATLGVRMVGMQLYESKTKSYSFVDKQEGRRIDQTQFRAYMQKFIRYCGNSRAAKLRQRLRALREALLDAPGYRFFSSSILVAFDSDTQDSNSEDAIRVMMIDFAHSTFTGFFNDSVYDGPDDGCLLGIDSILTAIDVAPSALQHQTVLTAIMQHQEPGLKEV